MPGSLTPDEVNEFLDGRSGWITLTTQSPSGYPHSVPIGYFRRGDDIYIGCRAPIQNTRNIERNPKVSLMLESGGSMQDIKGLLIQGDAALVLDDAERLELMRAGATARGVAEGDLPTEAAPGGAYIQVQPRHYVSWDYSKS